MAIQDSFNLNQAKNSQAYAYKCWYNYNYGGNTMKISSKDYGEITQSWKGELTNWRATASKDENAYEIPDDDFSAAKRKGKDQAKSKAGASGKKTGMWTRSSIDLAGGLVGTCITTIPAAGKLIKNGVKKIGSLFTKKAGKKAAEKGLEKGLEKGAQKGTQQATQQGSKKAKTSDWVTAGIVIASTVLYMAKKPNKTEKEACKELQNEMTNAQVALGDAQNEMSDMGDEIVALSDEAQMANEEANDGIEDKKTEYDMYRASYDALKAKLESGEPLSEDEKKLMKELVTLMQELGVNITNIQDDTTKNVEEIYDNMSSYQEGYDNAAETIAEVEGLTDYAESFDETTRTTCYVEAIGQGLNATNGVTAGGRLCATAGLNIGQWIMGGASIAAGVKSGFAAMEQSQWAGEVGTEIHMRRDTQGLNSTTTEMYDENIDVYAGQMEGVEELELEIPEDMEVPEETEIPTQQVPQDTTQTTSPQNSTTDDKDKDKKEK